MFRFGFPVALWLLALVPLYGLVVWIAGRRRNRLLSSFAESHLIQRLRESVRTGARRWKEALILVGLGLLATALARPQFGTRVETVTREGQDVMVVLDVSRSMTAEDLDPHRLGRAKIEVGRLIQRLQGDRIGLVAFAGDAFVQSPLTTDYGAAMMFLNAMETDLIEIQGTDLAHALSVAIEALEETPAGNRIIVAVTDGEDHEGGLPSAMEQAAEAGVVIHAVGVGSPDGVPLPDFARDGTRRGFRRDDDGSVITTRLDETALQDMALRTGGQYYRLGTPGDGLSELIEVIGGGGRELEARQITQFEEQYQIFLGLALAVLVLESLISTRRTVPRTAGEEWT
ncbi:MAG: VWA domain-containing protein [Gemmatimonadetes bacterium]|nr:VWA domain-containing protein [Gemmatimonadota bacterium]